MKPERIEELARACCEEWDEHTPMEIAAAIRTAIREFADEAVRRMDADPGAPPYAEMIEELRDEVLGMTFQDARDQNRKASEEIGTILGTTPGNAGEPRGTD